MAILLAARFPVVLLYGDRVFIYTLIHFVQLMHTILRKNGLIGKIRQSTVMKQLFFKKNKEIVGRRQATVSDSRRTVSDFWRKTIS